jgi:hypothetical protein
MPTKPPKYRFKDGLHPALASDHKKSPGAVIDCGKLSAQEQAQLCSDRVTHLTQKLEAYKARGLRASPQAIAEYEAAIAQEQSWLQSLTTQPLPAPGVSSPLLKAESINWLGLTKTQVFYLVGQQLKKGLCRFVKTDRLKDAICTLLALKGERHQVRDIRVGETKGSLRVFTEKKEVYIPSAEASAFLTRYNRLAVHGIQGECQCDDMWRHFCPHRIAEHLTSMQEKIEVVLRAVALQIQGEPSDAKAQLEQAKSQLEQQEINTFAAAKTSTIAQGNNRRRTTETEVRERENRELMEQKNRLFSSLLESGNLERHMEVQKATTSAKLTLKDVVASPYSTNVVDGETSQVLGILSWKDEGWAIALPDGVSTLVNSIAEAIVILRDPQQLAFDF